MYLKPSLLSLLGLAALSAQAQNEEALEVAERSYAPLDISSLDALVALSDSSELDFDDPNSFLSGFLVPRPVGSANLTRVHNSIKSRFATLRSKSSRKTPTWTLLEDHFDDQTPYGVQSFTNLVFTHNPEADLKLVLACHTDSKWSPTGFIGATDSAVPCSIIVDVAEALSEMLDAKEERLDQEAAAMIAAGDTPPPRMTLSMVFLDGEEAFKDWTSTDSIYGARHLAEEWSQANQQPQANTPRSNTLSQISTFVLLDLLGAPNPLIRNFYHGTGWLFDRLVDVESRLGQAGHLWEGFEGEEWAAESYTATPGAPATRSFFQQRTSTLQVMGGHIEDDHLPFMARGVPILHLIPVPFPSCWHKMSDDASCIDFGTIKAWNLLTRVMTAEFLDLSPTPPSRKRDEFVRFAKNQVSNRPITYACFYSEN